MRIRLVPQWAAWLLVAVLFGATVAWLAHDSVHNFLVQPDEESYISSARYVHDAFPHSLLASAYFPHGLQRLNIFLLAIVFGIAHAPFGFQLFHVLNTLAFASTAVPAYLLARTLGARVAAALAAALLVVLVPWAVVSASLLAEGVAYPVFAWTVLAMTRSVGASSRSRDALAVVALAIAPLARTSFLLLGGAFLVSLIVQALKYGDEPSAAGRLRRLPGRLWASHPVVAVAVGAGVAFLLERTVAGPGFTGEIKQLTSTYYSVTGASYSPGPVLDRSGYFLSRITVGVGVLPMIIGLPWLIIQAASKARADHSAFGLVVLTSAIVVLLTSFPTTPDERYVMYLAPAVIVAFVVAVDLRAPTPRAVGLGGLFAAGLLYHYGSIYQGSSAFSFFIFPAGTVVHYTVSRIRQDLGLGLSVSAAGVLLALALTAASAYVVAPGRRWRPVAAVLGIGLLAAQLLQTSFIESNFISKGAAGSHATQASLSWIDRVTRGSGWAFAPVGAGADRRYTMRWRATQFWNPDVVGPLYIDGVRHSDPTVGYTRADSASIDPAGLLHPAFPIPSYVAVPGAFQGIGIAGTRVAAAQDGRVVLLRRSKPASLTWLLIGAAPRGLIGAAQPVIVRFFRAALGDGPCAGIVLEAPASPSPEGPVRYSISAPAVRRVGEVAPAAGVLVEVPLSLLVRGSAHEDVRITVRRLPGAGQAALGVGGVTLGGCRP